MSGKKPGNIATSVRQRLLNKARSGQRPFSELLQYYAMERFLYRLSKSPHANRFILKGALMLRAWRSPEFRSTMDIDLLGKTDNNEALVVSQIRDIIAVDAPSDGLVFDPASIRAQRITEDADYEGIRIRSGACWIPPGSICRSISVLEISFFQGRKRQTFQSYWIYRRRVCFVTAVKAPLPKNSKPW